MIKSGISVGAAAQTVFKSTRAKGTDLDGVTKLTLLNDGVGRVGVWCRGHGGNTPPTNDADYFPLDPGRSMPFEIEVHDSSGTQIDEVIVKRLGSVDSVLAIACIRRR